MLITHAVVLKMVYGVGAEKIAGAIAESIIPCYGGNLSDINALEYQIVEGVKKIVGQAVKGTKFCSDSSEHDVGVIFNGLLQGTVSFGNRIVTLLTNSWKTLL